MDTLSATGRRMVFWGALLLLGWAVYELAIRIEEMTIWLQPVIRLAQQGKITLLDYFRLVDWKRLRTHVFLLACILFALYALLARKSAIAGLIAIPLAVLLAVFSLGSTKLMAANLWQKLKLVPLLLIGLGSLLRFIDAMTRKKRRKQEAAQPHLQQPYDPFKLKRD